MKAKVLRVSTTLIEQILANGMGAPGRKIEIEGFPQDGKIRAAGFMEGDVVTMLVESASFEYEGEEVPELRVTVKHFDDLEARIKAAAHEVWDREPASLGRIEELIRAVFMAENAPEVVS